VRYELLLLAELGFGLDLERCAVSGDDEDLIAVSPRSGRAVSAGEAEPYLGKLLPLPRFVRDGGVAGWPDIIDGLVLTGHFLLRDVITDRSTPVAAARHRLVDRLHRAAGLA
jgi:DNA repair protein RecO (recombination protein O)